MGGNSVSTRRPGTTRRKRSRLRSFVLALQILILLGISVSVGVGLGLFISLSKMLPNIENIEPNDATIVYSSDGVILGRVFREDRTNVPLKDIPENLRKAIVAVEDKRFYHHSGVDLRGLTGAMLGNLRVGKPVRGGSTITQQLAKNVFLSPEKTMRRKIQEAVLAILIERNFTKDKILELYLNQVYFGSGAFGVQAASKVYFGKDVGQLDLAECALLAGLPQRPTGYSPHENLEAAVGRRGVVLDDMAQQGMIAQSDAEAAKGEKPAIVRKQTGRSTYKAAHFMDYVTKQLRDRYGDDVLVSGGLRVYTTLNYKMQQAAEEALRNGVRNTEGCFVAIEPSTGYIRAMVGSANPASHYNRCVQGSGRQPGSSFKAFVYTAAMMAGMKPNDRESNARISLPGAVRGKMWVPRNYDGRYGGRPTLKQAVAQSINLVAIRVAQRVGIKNVVKYAQAMGITSELEPYLPIAIGGVKGVHPLEMASAYGTFANKGVHVAPSAIVKITNSKGETIDDFTPEQTTVIPENINAEMDELFRAVVTSRGGTGFRAGQISEARGKTGTTNDDRDAWFIGYVPGKMVAACWVGNDNYAPMHKAYGGLICAPIWVNFMRVAIPEFERIHRNDKAPTPKPGQTANSSDTGDHANTRQPERVRLPHPDATPSDDGDTVTRKVCDESGLLATANCPATHLERFAKGSEPTTYCTVHGGETRAVPAPRAAPPAETTLVTQKVCAESGLLPTPYCPRVVTRRIPVDQVPTQLCNIHARPR